MLDTIFGGSVSSRLFREVREKRGLAYSVGSYTHEFVDRGFVAMYVGTRADNVAEACEIIGRELAKLHAEGVSDDELARAKEHVKGRMVLGLESTGARMARLARGDPLRRARCSRSTRCSTRVDAVSADEVAELAARALRPGRASRRPASAPTRSCFRDAPPAQRQSEALRAR